MAVSITHTKVSAIADGGDDTLVRPSDWNAVHTFADIAPLASPTFTGVVSVPAGTTAAPGLIGPDANTGIVFTTTPTIKFVRDGIDMVQISGSEVQIVAASAPFGWSDCWLYKIAADTLGLRRGANAQSLKVYTSYTDASNYERFAINTAEGTITLAAETLGTGTDNIDLKLLPAGTGRVLFPDGAVATPSIAFSSETNTGFYRSAASTVKLAIGGAIAFSFYPTYFDILGETARIRMGDSLDLTLIREDPHILGLREGANSHTLRIYSFHTDASNWERLSISAAAGVATLAAETLGSGADNIDITLTPCGTGNVNITVGTLEVAGTQVVGARVIDARCDDAVNSGDATTDGVIDALRDAMITHGLIAAA